MLHRWIGHDLRHDGLLHEIIEGRMRGKPTIGSAEFKCDMIWQMMVALLQKENWTYHFVNKKSQR